MLELARVLKAEKPLERSVVFAVWTAEESGLLGSAAYAADPVYPLEKTVANLSLDILNTAVTRQQAGEQQRGSGRARSFSSVATRQRPGPPASSFSTIATIAGGV